jgi:hypothetical protein
VKLQKRINDLFYNPARYLCRIFGFFKARQLNNVALK